MIKLSNSFLLLVCVLVGLSGCASVESNLTNTFAKRSDDFGAYPSDYQQVIRQDFSKLATIHHPEFLDFKIRRPVKFYKVSHSGSEVIWYAWVAEVAVPEKAVYKFLSGDSSDWTVYYVRFSGGKITEVIHGEDYAYLKSQQGYELVEQGNTGYFRALNRGAVVNKTYNTLISFRDDLPPLTEVEQAKLQTPKTQGSQQPVSEQLRELHQLYQEGIISEQEFTAKKKQLLEL